MSIKSFISLFVLNFLLLQVPIEVTGMKSLNQQETSIKGRVLRSDIKQPIIGAEIILLDQEKINRSEKNMETKTDENGNYSFFAVKPGRYTVGFSMKYKSESDLPCGYQKDRFINDGIGVTSWMDKEEFVEIATSPEFSVSAGNSSSSVGATSGTCRSYGAGISIA